MYKKIIVCIDDTPLSERVTQVAADLASRYGASIVLLSVVDSARIANPPYSGLEAVEMIERHSRSLTNTTHRMSVMLREAGVLNHEMVLPGRSVETILKVAETEDADLIVIGSEARGRLEAWLKGDLCSEISHKAACNVLRVTPDSAGEGRTIGGMKARHAVTKRLLPTSISAL